MDGEIPLFFVVTKSVDEDKERDNLDKAIKEHFPYSRNIQIFPLLARSSKRNASFGLDELMNETKNFFEKKKLTEIFKYIYKNKEKNYTHFFKFLK